MLKTFLNEEQQNCFCKKYDLKLQKNYKQDLIEFIKNLAAISKLENINIVYNDKMDKPDFKGNYFIAIPCESIFMYNKKFFIRYTKFNDIVTEKEYNTITRYFSKKLDEYK